ncbi:MAG: hypothetical protein ACP5JT_02000 [Thermoplasmata archaeon]|jgi:hypothetical protein
MHRNSNEKLVVETLWSRHCRFCKESQLCRFHKILNDLEIDPNRVNLVDIRKFGQSKKYSVRLIYMSNKIELVELSLSFPSMDITVIKGAGKDRKSIITLKFSEKLINELFIISNPEDIPKYKRIDDPIFKKIYKNTIGD